MTLLNITCLLGIMWALISILILLFIDLFTRGRVSPDGEENIGDRWLKVQKRKKHILCVSIGVFILLIILTGLGIYIK